MKQIEVSLRVEQSRFKYYNNYSVCTSGRASPPDCVKCPSGKYNLGGAICQTCPDRGPNCTEGGYKVQASPGFWQGPPYYRSCVGSGTLGMLNETGLSMDHVFEMNASCAYQSNVPSFVLTTREEARRRNDFIARIYPCQGGTEACPNTDGIMQSST